MPETVNPAIFRAYDIRGLVGHDLTDTILRILGQATGTFLQQRGASSVVVGRDVRPSSPQFQAALIDGVLSTGLDVIDIGEVATPVMYFAVEQLGTDGGIVISASHNPPEYNGVKLRRSHPTYGSEPLSAADIQEVGAIAQRGIFATGRGTLQQHDSSDAYIANFQQLVHLPTTGATRPRVVLDGGNGVGGPLALRALEAIGVEVLPLFIEPDGTFPNHHPDPLKAENLQDLIREVQAQGADLGIALDGDADRLGVVDNTGTIVWADRYLIVLAQSLLQQRKGAVVFDVKCSTVLRDALETFGGTPVMWKTGYPNISAKMRELDAVLGGELSGHTILPLPGHYFDDGAFAGASLLQALATLGAGKPLTLADALRPYPVLPTHNEGRIAFPEHAKAAVVTYVREQFAPHYPVIDVDGVRVDFGDGWGVIRASNTEPAITTRFEAATEQRLQAIRAMMLETVENFRATQLDDGSAT